MHKHPQLTAELCEDGSKREGYKPGELSSYSTSSRYANVLRDLALMNATKMALLENNITMPADILELKVYNEKLPIPIRLVDKRKNNGDENSNDGNTKMFS